MNNNTDKRIIDEKTPLLMLAGPMFGEMFLNILVNNVDTLMLSRHNELAVGAVGNSNQVMFLVILMFNIIATVGYTMGIVFQLGVAGVFFGTATDEFLRGLIVMRHWYLKKWYGKALVKKENKQA